MCMLYQKLYFSLVFYLFWTAGVARLALGIHPLWHFSNLTGVVYCGWFVDTLAYYYFNCWVELYWELAVVLCFYRLPAAGLTKQAHLNMSVTLNLSLPIQLPFKPLCKNVTVAATVKFAGGQVALVGLLGSEMHDNEFSSNLWLGEHFISKPTWHPLLFWIYVVCHYPNIDRLCLSEFS